MKGYISTYFYWILLSVFCASCTDEWFEKQNTASAVDDSRLVEARLSLGVTDMKTTLQTRSETDDTPAERMINDIWVFQFNENGQLLITPRYYDIDDVDPGENGAVVDVLLRKDVANSTVYVVANVGIDDWATVENAATFTGLQNLTLPNPNIIVGEDALGEKEEESDLVTDNPDNLNIPMEGYIENVTFTDEGSINVPLTRMYAKVIITVGSIPETIVLTDVTTMDVPRYCRVKSLETDDLSQAAEYPIEERDWISVSPKPGSKNDKGEYEGRIVIYIPENLQGQSDNAESNPERKDKTDKPHAFGIRLYANYVDIFTGDNIEARREYSWYPGENNYNDYNIRRNYIYNVELNIYTDTYELDIPSSNCFVVKPGQLLSFLPYYRVETGGGYSFTNYLNADGKDEAKKINGSTEMTQNVKIIWQTEDAIGDNSKGDLVWIDPAPADDLDDQEKYQQEFHRKIYVRAGKRGNALIAAYNSEGEIVWSWHIWVTENEPGNVSSAILYTTYAWNEEGINTNIRVPGYDIMPCNLGALRNEPDPSDAGNTIYGTYGMLYQWGRKDPFPPATQGNNCADYNDDNTGGSHYANDNETTVGKTVETDENKLFHSLDGDQINRATLPDPIGFTIKNPTVFMCGTFKANTRGTNNYNTVNNDEKYANEGDWTWEHDDKLWGGLDPDTGDLKYYEIPNQNARIYDNYGDQKTIFDPCPSGWRVPPGDLWLGFTETGLNPQTYDEINTSGTRSYGMYMYMTDFKKGPTSFFPTQGTRAGDGGIMRHGSCGNYHNATTDLDDRVNILHIHNSVELFHIFETNFYFYYVKSTAGPIRCVRDHK